MTRQLIGLVLALLGAYGVMEALPLVLGPSLALSSPAPYATASSTLTVSGRALRIAALTLDGAPVLTDQDGSFSSTITLPDGGSILTLTARDRFGRSVTLTRNVYVP